MTHAANLVNTHGNNNENYGNSNSKSNVNIESLDNGNGIDDQKHSMISTIKGPYSEVFSIAVDSSSETEIAEEPDVGHCSRIVEKEKCKDLVDSSTNSQRSQYIYDKGTNETYQRSIDSADNTDTGTSSRIVEEDKLKDLFDSSTDLQGGQLICGKRIDDTDQCNDLSAGYLNSGDCLDKHTMSPIVDYKMRSIKVHFSDKRKICFIAPNPHILPRKKSELHKKKQLKAKSRFSQRIIQKNNK